MLTIMCVIYSLGMIPNMVFGFLFWTMCEQLDTRCLRKRPPFGSLVVGGSSFQLAECAGFAFLKSTALISGFVMEPNSCLENKEKKVTLWCSRMSWCTFVLKTKSWYESYWWLSSFLYIYIYARNKLEAKDHYEKVKSHKGFVWIKIWGIK